MKLNGKCAIKIILIYRQIVRKTIPNDRKNRIYDRKCLYFVLPVLSVLLTLSLFEVVGRVFLKTSDTSYGVLLGRELPPKTVIPISKSPKIDPDAGFENLVVDGKKITKSDLWGMMQEDPVVGWVPRKKAVSTNRWWRTNNFGARADQHITQHKQPGRTRVLLFGDSFTQGSRLPQAETWAYQLEKRNPGFEVFNFGVDGYGMGQSFLRYQNVQAGIDYDVVLFLFVPSVDLWRDINTIRSLCGDWISFAITPRFIIKDDRLEYVKSPYQNLLEVDRENHIRLSPKARNYLRKYDRFYIRALYEDRPFLKYLISYKIAALFYGNRKIRMVYHQAFEDPNSEAWQVARKIFDTVKTLASKREANFILAILPTHLDIHKAQQDEHFRKYWHNFVAKFIRSGLNTVDLLPRMSSAPLDELDYGYDDSHYGPKASFLIADILASAIKKYQ